MNSTRFRGIAHLHCTPQLIDRQLVRMICAQRSSSYDRSNGLQNPSPGITAFRGHTASAFPIKSSISSTSSPSCPQYLVLILTFILPFHVFRGRCYPLPAVAIVGPDNACSPRSMGGLCKKCSGAVARSAAAVCPAIDA